jgi:hypothetical protein
MNNPLLCGRLLPSPLDAWFVLGNRCALPLLEEELATYDYHRNLAAMDWLVSRYDEGFWSANFYNVWLSALRALSTDTTQPPYPSVMQTEEWDRRMLHAQLASWAQLRHDTLLYAKPSYTSVGSCQYPDAWADPYPEFYLKLAELARDGLEELDSLGVFELPSGTRIRRYFESLQSHSDMLVSIARAELENMPLNEEQTRFVKDLWKWGPWGGSAGAYADGWYQELIFEMSADVLLHPEGVGLPERYTPTIADIHTDPNSTNILHVGVTHPNLMLISVETTCATKAYVGPVFSYHEIVEPDMKRLTDEEWKAETEGLLWNPDAPAPPRPEWTQAFIR